jgi:hypothetical protein
LNKDVNVRFSITGGADKDEFEILPDEKFYPVKHLKKTK